MLQWGRGLKTPETRAASAARETTVALQWGRGLKTPETRRCRGVPGQLRCFNGAGVLRPRKLDAIDRDHVRGRASMGPGS